MTVFTNPQTWDAGEMFNATKANTGIRDNLLALKDPPSDVYDINEAGNYTTTSTSFTAIDATDLTLSIDTTGGDVLVVFHGNVKTASSFPTDDVRIYFDVAMDGVSISHDDGICMVAGTDSGADGRTLRHVDFQRLIRNVDADTHTFALMWKTTAAVGVPTATLYAAAGTANLDLHGQFFARETS